MADARDKMWGDIRQIVLGDGPVPDEINRQLDEMREQAFEQVPDEIFNNAREALFAELVIIRAAQIIRTIPGSQMEGAPLHFILGALAGECMQRDIRHAVSGLVGLLMADDEEEGE